MYFVYNSKSLFKGWSISMPIYSKIYAFILCGIFFCCSMVRSMISDKDMLNRMVDHFLSYSLTKDLKGDYKNGFEYKKENMYLFSKPLFMEAIQKFHRIYADFYQQLNLHNNYLIRKKIVPAGSRIEFHGDLHGDVHTLCRWIKSLQREGVLDGFTITQDDFYCCFLGDYSDRGAYGAEVIFLILQLYFHNPKQVILIRGNHEDYNVAQCYGFARELELKLKLNTRDMKSVFGIYEYLPVVFFLGCKNSDNVTDYILCCHGGIEPGYTFDDFFKSESSFYVMPKVRKPEEWFRAVMNQINLIKDSLKDYDRIIARLKKLNSENFFSTFISLNGFQWMDFDFDNVHPDDVIEVDIQSGRAALCKDYTDALLQSFNKNNCAMHAVFRAHQHSPSTMKTICKKGNGIYKLWPEVHQQWNGKAGIPVILHEKSVWTFNVAPCVGHWEQFEGFEPFDYDTVARLTVKPDFKNWVLEPRHIVETRKKKRLLSPHIEEDEGRSWKKRFLYSPDTMNHHDQLPEEEKKSL